MQPRKRSTLANKIPLQKIVDYTPFMASPAFVHPVSHDPLTQDGAGMRCAATGEFFPFAEGKPCFVPQKIQVHMEGERSGIENAVKTLLRKVPWLYVALIYVISPVCHTGMSAQKFRKRFPQDKLLLNIGSGVHGFTGNVLNVDIFPYKGVDVVANAEQLPFADNSVDGAICESLLEHVPNPRKIVEEMYRVLKPGGSMYIVIPFVYPFHASPNDFYRWSVTGLKELLRGGEIERIAPRSGPTSALMGQLTTWAAIVLSFGSHTVYTVLNMLFLLVFFPIKFLDYLFSYYPTAINGSNQFYAIARKKA